MTNVDEHLANGNSKFLQVYKYKTITQIITQLNTFFIWQWLSVIRAIFAIIGWIIFAINPNFNYTINYIKKLMKN